MDEEVEIFNEKYVNIGGDEVDFDWWERNKYIIRFMEDRKIKGNFKRVIEID
jgi:hypothetical protein